MKLLLSSHYTVLLAVILAGCTSDDDYKVVDSPGVATSSISAQMHVSYTGSQLVTVEVLLREGPVNSDTDINLISGDTLKASTMGDPSHLNYGDNLYDNLIEISNQVKTLQQGTRRIYNRIIAGIWYYASTDSKYRHEEFTVALLRGGQNDAPHSVVRLPPDMNISVDELATSSILSRSGPITVRWSPANPDDSLVGYSMEISGFVTCANGASGEWSSGVFDNPPGNPIDSYEIAANTFAGYAGECIVTLGVESSTLGSADSALHPSSFIRAHQYRTLAIDTAE